MKTLNLQTKNFIGYLLVGTAVLLFFFYLIQCQGADIWYDEVFSTGFAARSYKEIVTLTAQDVHPPLYYFYLRFMQQTINFIFPRLSAITIYKAASVLPMAGLLLYAVTFVRKRMGIMCCGLFCCFMMAMPQLPSYTVEIRMYSLALFLITAGFLHACELVYTGKKIHWCFLFLYGILTAYTQYYACVAIIGLYICLLIYLFLKRKEYPKGLKWWTGCVIVSVLAYLPWLAVLKNQMTKVSAGYWIEPLSLRSIPGCLKFIFLPVSNDTAVDYFLAVCMILCCVGILFIFLKKYRTGEGMFIVLTGIAVLLFVVLTGFLFSILSRPVFVYRYMIPTLGIFWLAVSYCICLNCNKRLELILLVPFLLAGVFSVKGFYEEEHKKQLQMEHTQEALKQLPEDAVILCNFNHVQAVCANYLDNEIYLYEGTPETLISQLLPECRELLGDGALQELVSQNRVYFFGSFWSREDLIAEWEELGIRAAEKDSCLLERYWFNIYELKMEK